MTNEKKKELEEELWREIREAQNHIPQKTGEQILREIREAQEKYARGQWRRVPFWDKAGDSRNKEFWIFGVSLLVVVSVFSIIIFHLLNAYAVKRCYDVFGMETNVPCEMLSGNNP